MDNYPNNTVPSQQVAEMIANTPAASLAHQSLVGDSLEERMLKVSAFNFCCLRMRAALLFGNVLLLNLFQQHLLEMGPCVLLSHDLSEFMHRVKQGHGHDLLVPCFQVMARVKTVAEQTRGQEAQLIRQQRFFQVIVISLFTTNFYSCNSFSISTYSTHAAGLR